MGRDQVFPKSPSTLVETPINGFTKIFCFIEYIYIIYIYRPSYWRPKARGKAFYRCEKHNWIFDRTNSKPKFKVSLHWSGLTEGVGEFKRISRTSWLGLLCWARFCFIALVSFIKLFWHILASYFIVAPGFINDLLATDQKSLFHAVIWISWSADLRCLGTGNWRENFNVVGVIQFAGDGQADKVGKVAMLNPFTAGQLP